MFDIPVELPTASEWGPNKDWRPNKLSKDEIGQKLTEGRNQESKYIVARAAMLHYGVDGRRWVRNALPMPSGWLSFLSKDPLEGLADYAKDRALSKLQRQDYQAGSMLVEEAAIDLRVEWALRSGLLPSHIDAQGIMSKKTALYTSAMQSLGSAEQAILEMILLPSTAQQVLALDRQFAEYTAIKVLDLYWGDAMGPSLIKLQRGYAQLAEATKDRAPKKHRAHEENRQRFSAQLTQCPPTNLFFKLDDHIQAAIDLIGDRKAQASLIIKAAMSRDGVTRSSGSDYSLYASSGRWKW